MKEPVVWADAATPFTGRQVADLLRENERLRDVAQAALAFLAAYDGESDAFERDTVDELRAVLWKTEAASVGPMQIDAFNDGTLNPCVELHPREENVITFVDELTGGMSAETEAKLRALLRRER